MAAYQNYKDANGVTWTIITTGSSMFATQPADANPRYVPDPTDVGPFPLMGGGTDPEAERQSFARLREQLDKFAAENAKSVALVVTPDKGSGGGAWLWLLLLWAIAEGG